MLTKEKILRKAAKKGMLHTREVADEFSVSRQYASGLIAMLVAEHKLFKLGSTRKAFYVLPTYAQRHKEIFPQQYQKAYKNVGLEEHKVLDQMERTFPLLRNLSESVRSIFAYAFSEMFNNAIEHSRSVLIRVNVSLQKKMLTFVVSDSGIGVFRNVMQKRKLQSELEVMQDLLKGKTTTSPKSHSGEGIFFTSKAADIFSLDSFGYQLIVNNEIPDVFFKKTKKLKRGTKVTFTIHAKSRRHLTEVFRQYTNMTKDSDYGFDKTMVQIKLYTIGGVYISRSQARRVLAGLEKFKVIVFDFDKVPVVGQAFADEIFRVFHNTHPRMRLETVNMQESVEFMIERAKTEAKLSGSTMNEAEMRAEYIDPNQMNAEHRQRPPEALGRPDTQKASQ